MAVKPSVLAFCVAMLMICDAAAAAADKLKDAGECCITSTTVRMSAKARRRRKRL